MTQRIIKFRAWDTKAKKMLHNVSTGTQTIYGDAGEGKAEIQDCYFMQFTGLHDKNGKEIYEGDIYSFGDGTPNKVVEWGRAGWYLPNEELIEVIGNIYENPELLK